jgi:hypothetical protein
VVTRWATRPGGETDEFQSQRGCSINMAIEGAQDGIEGRKTGDD